MRGSCLCGGVAFEVDQFAGPFELCHCSRCRKSGGSAFAAMVGVERRNFRWLSGTELVAHFDAPILHHPPAYRASFCRCCGSSVPDPEDDSAWFEIPAGLLDDDPVLRPDRHIFVEHKAPWVEILDDLPQLDLPALAALRRAVREGDGEV